MRRTPLLLLVAALLTVGAAGCGAVWRVNAGHALQISVSEYRITPQDVHAQTGVLTIVVHNFGRLSHNLVISRAGVAEASTKPIVPGGWAQLDAVLAPGRYLMASSLVSDQALGTYGTLNVGGRYSYGGASVK